MSFLYDYIGNLILSIAQIYSWHNISKKNFKIGILKIILLSLFLTLFITINHNYGEKHFKGLIILIIAIVFCKLIMHFDIKKSLLLTFMSQVIVIISEAILVAFFNLFLNYEIYVIMHNVYISIFFDIVLSILIIVLSKMRIFSIIYIKIIKLTKYIKINQIIVLITFILIGSSIFCTTIYFRNNYLLSLTLNTAIPIIYTVIVILMLRYQNKYSQVNLKYHLSLKDLNSQEKLISDYRIMTHENKNNLQTIKSMTKNKDINKFINSLLSNQEKICDNVITDALKIPSRGIRAVIYNKINYMKENNICYNINIDKQITHNTFAKLSDDDIVDLCQLISIYMDNAIEETIKYKDKSVNFEFHYERNKLYISICNYYNSENFDDTFVSTKATNRGHGLQLAKRIVENNRKIETNLVLNKDIYKQVIKIKI